MPQFRKDPVTSRWVIVNVEAPKTDYAVAPHVKSSKTCPFCPGNEAMTPPEITAYGRKSGPKAQSGWLVRVVPNKFPALKIEETTEKTAIGLYDKLGGFGAHEVIIENPDHEKEIADLSLEEVELILRVYRERCLDLRKDTRIRYILIFKNYGAAAGASLEHPHSQLIALPIVPSRVTDEIQGSLAHFRHTERCLYCDILDQERSEKKRLILEGDDFVVLAPFAARFPFETWIVPRHHEASFDSIEDSKVRGLAMVLRATLGKIKKELKDPSFNFMIHSVPIGHQESASYHWHIEIIPNLTQVAGFELGTGFYLNPTPPEIAALVLKKSDF